MRQVIYWFAGTAEVELQVIPVRPGVKGLRRELRAIVHRNALREAPRRPDSSHDAGRIFTGETRGHGEAQA